MSNQTTLKDHRIKDIEPRSKEPSNPDNLDRVTDLLDMAHCLLIDFGYQYLVDQIVSLKLKIEDKTINVGVKHG